MRIFVLGANGFIGSEIVSLLLKQGYTITGLTRNVKKSQVIFPTVKWVYGDIGKLLTPQAWQAFLKSHDVVINCAGVLQDGLKASVENVQFNAMTALYTASKQGGIQKIIQISADTGGNAGLTAFLHTKKQADDTLKASGLPYTILRPSLVIGRNAFGGTALLRGLSAFPFVLPLVYKNSPLETVTVQDVAKAVLDAVQNTQNGNQDIYLASSQVLSVEDLVKLHRRWLGLRPVPVISVPEWMGFITSKIADGLGLLGWRSPLRSTAMHVMKDGIVCRMPPSEVMRITELETAESFLARHPSDASDVWFARLYMLKPVVFGVLSLFWMASGIIPLIDISKSAQPFTNIFSQETALLITYGTCFLDITLGVVILHRKTAKIALMGMMCISLSYIIGSLLIQPLIWLDPVGSMVKVIPILVFMLVALIILEER